MNKLLILSLLALICVANTSARFLEESKAPQTGSEVTITPGNQEKPVDSSEVQQNDKKSTDKPVENKQDTSKEQTIIPVEEQNSKDKTEGAKVDPAEESNKQQENKEEEKNEKKEEEGAVITEEGDNNEKSYFGISLSLVLLLVFGVLFFFVGFYRYSLRKYKIPPFTPPNFCPNFLFPRPENDLLMEDYYIQSSNNEMGSVYSAEKYHNFY